MNSEKHMMKMMGKQFLRKKVTEQYDHLNKFNCMDCGHEFLSRGVSPKCPECKSKACVSDRA